MGKTQLLFVEENLHTSFLVDNFKNSESVMSFFFFFFFERQNYRDKERFSNYWYTHQMAARAELGQLEA